MQAHNNIEENVLVLSVDGEARAVTARFHGAITAGDFQRARERITKQRGWEPGYAQIFDFTDVTALNLTTAEIRAAALTAPADEHAAQFIVAKPCSISLGLARMIQAFAAGRRVVHVVDSPELALHAIRVGASPPQVIHHRAKRSFGGHARWGRQAANRKRRR